MHFHRATLTFTFCLVLATAAPASAERFCDTAFEDCRTPLIQLIRNETVGIDVAFWFMEDARYAAELIRRRQAGVPVRVIMDARAVTQYGYTNAGPPLDRMREGGIPMRTKVRGGILHFKAMIFAGQNVVEFSAANYSSEAFVPIQPFVNYVDEIIYFSDNPAFVNSFKRRFDDIWTDTTSFADYANMSGPPVRHYPMHPIAPELNFVPWQNFRSRSVAEYRGETQGIDAIMYRITDRAHSDEMIAAVGRGVPVRLIVEPEEYRSEERIWNAWNIDRMYAAGVQVRQRKHAGLLHEKLTLLTGKGMTIFGSSNWTSASASSQHEHNLFTTDPAFFQWARAHFLRKWTNSSGFVETELFVPLPPDTPVLVAPANGADGQGTSVTLRWYAGPWAHKYDVYLGTSPSALTRVLTDRELGPSTSTSDHITWTLSGLAAGTTYYWRVVSRTMANLERTSATWSFRTGGSPTGPTTPAVSAVSASPASGSGAAQVFALQYASSLGATDLENAWVWFNATFAASAGNSCMAYYNRATNTVFLLNDAATAWQPAALGSPTTLRNRQCSIALSGSSASSSGNTLTVNLAVTFSSGFAGAKNIYVFASSARGANSGWQDRGDWIVPASAASVNALSATPSGGTGTVQTFTLQYSDSAGAADIASAWVWFNAAFSASAASSCLAYYDAGTHSIFLLNDAATAWQQARVGSASTLGNSQCRIAANGSGASRSGNTLIVNVAVTFLPAYRGSKNIYMFAASRSGVNTGWQDRGNWTVP